MRALMRERAGKCDLVIDPRERADAGGLADGGVAAIRANDKRRGKPGAVLEGGLNFGRAAIQADEPSRGDYGDFAPLRFGFERPGKVRVGDVVAESAFANLRGMERAVRRAEQPPGVVDELQRL